MLIYVQKDTSMTKIPYGSNMVVSVILNTCFYIELLCVMIKHKKPKTHTPKNPVVKKGTYISNHESKLAAYICLLSMSCFVL